MLTQAIKKLNHDYADVIPHCAVGPLFGTDSCSGRRTASNDNASVAAAAIMMRECHYGRVFHAQSVQLIQREGGGISERRDS